MEHVSKTRWDVAFCSCFAVKYATSPETDPLSYFWILCLIFTPFSSQRIARLLKLAGGRRARRSEFGRRGGHSPAPRRDLRVGGGGSGPWEGHPSPRTPGAPGTAPSPRRGAGSPAGVRERERERGARWSDEEEARRLLPPRRGLPCPGRQREGSDSNLTSKKWTTWTSSYSLGPWVSPSERWGSDDAAVSEVPRFHGQCPRLTCGGCAVGRPARPRGDLAGAGALR